MASCISFRFRKPVAKQRKLRMCSTKSIFANGTHRLRNHNGLQAAAIFKRTGTDTVCRFRQLDLTQLPQPLNILSGMEMILSGTATWSSRLQSA